MKGNTLKYSLVAVFFALTLASCEKTDSVATPATVAPTVADDLSTPFTEELTVEKGHYEVAPSGRVYTSAHLLYSKVHCKVMLTKMSERNASTFSLAETGEEYVMTVRRMKSPTLPTHVAGGLSTTNPEELTMWIISSTAEGHEVYICYDPAASRWVGHVASE
ncbi:MAG: hypothetical protein IJ789_08675 [Bacteroidales bacterium]|nr:hypothetical protein [Bacteroidales bacterium]